MRQTSIEAYLEINKEGLIGKMQRSVYMALYEQGPMTGTELNDFLGGYSFHKRLSELRDMGMIKELDKRRCRISGRMAVEWDVKD